MLVARMSCPAGGRRGGGGYWGFDGTGAVR